MPVSAPAFLTNTAKLSVAVLLVLAGTAGLAAAKADELVYRVTFDNGSLAPQEDQLGIGPMKTGDTQVTGSNPTWTPLDGEIILQITRPVTATGPVAAGVFANPVNFGPGTAFEEQATFISPVGPNGVHDYFAVALSARTGDNIDVNNTAARVTLGFAAGTHLYLNAIAADKNISVPIPQEIEDSILSPTNPQAFTTKLLIDRVTGSGRISLVVGDRTVSHDANFPAFPADSGPVITALGPSIAIKSGPGATASVHLTEFRILKPSNSSANSAATCSEAWARLNCRAVPTTH